MEQYGNNVTTTLAGAINDSVTSITVADGSVFPASGDFRIRIDDEIILVTARAGNVFTATRGQEGTSAASHADAAVVNHILTAASLLMITADGFGFGPFASRPAAGRKGRNYYCSDLGIASYDDGSNWVAYVPGHAAFNAADTTSLSSTVTSNVNLTINRTAQAGTELLDFVSTSGGGNIAIYKAAPATPYKVTVCFQLHYRGISSNGPLFAIGFRKSATGYMKTFAYHFASNNNAVLAAYRYTSITTFAAADISNQWYNLGWGYGLNWLRIEDDGTNNVYSFSKNGYDWIKFYERSRTAGDGDTNPADQICLFGTVVNTNAADYIHKLSARLYSYQEH